jgi:hypothetical protein
MHASQRGELLETVQRLDAAGILAFRPLIREAAVMQRAAEALATAVLQRYAHDAYRCGFLHIGELFTSLAYIWDFTFDFPGINTWCILIASVAAMPPMQDEATAMLLSKMPVECCGINFNEPQDDSSPLMWALQTHIGPKTISTLIRLGARFAPGDSLKIMPAIAACDNLQTVGELLALAARTRVVADASQTLDSQGTALHLCCTHLLHALAERVEMLLNFGVCPLRRDATGCSARQCLQVRMARLQLHFAPEERAKYLGELKQLRLAYNALLRAEEAAMKTPIFLV